MTAEIRCAICGSTVGDAAYACARCGIDKPAGQLQAVADMLDAARDVAHGISRHAGGGGSTGKPGSRLPFNLAATSRLDAVQNELTTTVRHIASERGLVPPWVTSYDDPIAASVRFLLSTPAGSSRSNLEWLRHQRDVTDWLPGIERCAQVMRSVVAGPRDHEYLGPCGAPTDEDVSVWDGEREWTMFEEGPPCPGDIYAPRGASVGRCRDCGAEVASEDRRAWLDAQIRSEAFTALEIARAYDIPVKTIRSWATDRPEVRNPDGKLARSATPARLRSYWRTTAGLIAPWSDVAEDLDAPRLHYAGDVLDLAAADAARRAGEQAKRQRRKDTAA